MNKNKVIHSISGPRNISTALMYSFAQRPNCEVIDEPFYAAYLKKKDLNHPGKMKTLKLYPNSFGGSIQRVQQFISSSEAKEVYIKNMAQHMVNVNWDWAREAIHIFWIRHPRKVIRSFSKVLPDVILSDIGIEEQVNQWKSIQKFSGPKIIVNSDEMLSEPEKTFPIICDAIGIPFFKEMLCWPQGRKEYDGAWWPYWYSNVHKSSYFEKGSKLGNPLEKKYSKIEIEALEYYMELYHQRLVF
jgi:hypothetical protein